MSALAFARLSLPSAPPSERAMDRTFGSPRDASNATPGADREGTAGAAAAGVTATPAPAAAAILARFAAFKAGPTAEVLEQLLIDIDAWRAERAADPDAAPEPAAAQIEKLGALLAQKGRAYLAAKSG
jgi:hypothetical protein